VKKASPSKGVIAADFPYLKIAQEYRKAGAAAISVLTEPEYFKGDDAYLLEIVQAVNLPVLRKDFVVDAYQIYEARLLGASAVLLIAALLGGQLSEMLYVCETLGLSALTETHTAEEAERAVKSGARIIGVNNRDLQTFEVNLETSRRLRALVPTDRLFVAESGIQTPDDVAKLAGIGADGVLIGETLMRAEDKVSALTQLRSLIEGK
jgi:indole-3-glycerol phosphate synthase